MIPHEIKLSRPSVLTYFPQDLEESVYLCGSDNLDLLLTMTLARLSLPFFLFCAQTAYDALAPWSGCVRACVCVPRSGWFQSRLDGISKVHMCGLQIRSVIPLAGRTIGGVLYTGRLPTQIHGLPTESYVTFVV